jgi:excisionase family DNA binding protein
VTTYRPHVTSFLTVQECAAKLRVSKMTIYREIHAQRLLATRAGRSFRVPEREFDQYISDGFRRVDTEYEP